MQGGEETEKYGQGAVCRKIKLKLRILLYDLVLNDDNIKQDEPFHVRDTIINDEPLLQHLLDTIQFANLQTPQEGQLREYTMMTLYRVYQRKPDLKDRIGEVLEKHITNVTAAINTMPDRAESLQDELQLVQKVLDAPNQPMRVNFDVSQIKKTNVLGGEQPQQ